MTKEEKQRARGRSGHYRRNGELVPQPCASCGSSNVEMHHPDYSNDRDVRWLCMPCHKILHSQFQGVLPPDPISDARKAIQIAERKRRGF